MDTLQGTNGAKFAVFFADFRCVFCRFLLERFLRSTAFRRRRFSRSKPQETSDFRRKLRESADFRRNPFVLFSLSVIIPPNSCVLDLFGVVWWHLDLILFGSIWTNTRCVWMQSQKTMDDQPCLGQCSAWMRSRAVDVDAPGALQFFLFRNSFRRGKGQKHIQFCPVTSWVSGGGGSPDRVARGQMFMCRVRKPRNINIFVRVCGREDR